MSIFEYNEEVEREKLKKAEYEAGLQEGEKRGIEQGEKHLTDLIALLLQEGKMDDIKRITQDAEFRNQLFEQYKL